MEGGGVGKTAWGTSQVQFSPNGHVTYTVAYTHTTPSCLDTPTHNMGHFP